MDLTEHYDALTLLPRQSYGLQATTLQTTRTIERVLFAFGGIALFNMVELLCMIPLRFNSWKGLYFWSLTFSTIGILPYTLGLLFKFFGVIQGYPLVYLAITLIDFGWHLMVTGQSVVLYSRLSLICRDRRVRQAVLWMIITNWFISNVPTTVFVFGAASENPGPYTKIYGVWERLQLCLYFMQEVIISGIYCIEIMRMLRPDFFTKQETDGSKQSSTSGHSFGKYVRSSNTNQRTLRHLLWVNAIIIALDITLLVVEFIGHYEIQTLYKGFVYSVKLKMEFRILNQLTDVAQSRLRSSQAHFDSHDYDSLGFRGGSTGTGCDPRDCKPRANAQQTLGFEGYEHASMRHTLGVLPDVEKFATDDDARGRTDSVVPNKDIEARKSTSGIQPLESCMAGRSSGSRSRSQRPSTARVVSFTEGVGPSMKEDAKNNAKWRAAMGDNDDLYRDGADNPSDLDT